MSESAELGPMSVEKAQALVRERIAQLDATIQSETERFMAEREQVFAYPVRCIADQERLSHRLRQLADAFEYNLRPVRWERERMINAIVHVMEAEPLKFYVELTRPY